MTTAPPDNLTALTSPVTRNSPFTTTVLRITTLTSVMIPEHSAVVVITSESVITTITPTPSTNSLTTEIPVSTTTPKPNNNRRDIIIGLSAEIGVGIFCTIIAVFIILKRRGLKGRKQSDMASPDQMPMMQAALASTVTVVLPNCQHNECYDGDSLVKDRATVSTMPSSSDSTRALLSRPTKPPIPIPSLPVASFEQTDRISIHETPPRLSQPVHNSYVPEDTINPISLRHGRPLPIPLAAETQLGEDSESFPAATEVPGMTWTTEPPSSWRPDSKFLDKRWHADSGVRLDSETLSYDETNLVWSSSLRSKDMAPPPLYTRD